MKQNHSNCLILLARRGHFWPSRERSRRCFDMAINRRKSRDLWPFCIICGANKPKERANSPYCSRRCLWKMQDVIRKRSKRKKRVRDAERKKHRCQICGTPVQHPRKYCPGHLCTRCGKAAVKAKGLCWNCYLRQYRGSVKEASAERSSA